MEEEAELSIVWDDLVGTDLLDILQIVSQSSARNQIQTSLHAIHDLRVG